MITKVAGVEMLWMVMATDVSIPKGVTGASLAIHNINYAAFGKGTLKVSLS